MLERTIFNATYAQGIDNFTVPTSGIYYFAFNCYSSSFSDKLLLDDVVFEQTSGTSCSGTPSAVANGPSSTCPDSTFTLSIAGTFPGGIGFQWQSSPAGQNNFSNISSAINQTYTTSQSSSTDYRCLVYCIFSGQQATSNIISVNSPAFCYCIPPANNCTGPNYITNVNFGGLNNSSACSANAYADYVSVVPAANVTANTMPTLSVTFAAGGSGNRYAVAWIDFNHNGLFETSERCFANGVLGPASSTSGTAIIPFAALPGLTRMRVRYYRSDVSLSSFNPCGAFAESETEDYSVNISAYVCSGTPSAGTASGPSISCIGDSMTLNATGTYLGLNLQWQSSPPGANTFTSIPGATSSSFKTIQSSSTDYRCVVTCSASGSSVFTNIVSVNTPAVCYCIPPALCTPNNYITRVRFGSLDNSSTCISGYSDYTSTVAAPSINAGTTASLILTLGSGSTGRIAAWIDFDRNQHFEPTEFFDLGTGNNNTITRSISIPSNASAGITRIRIRRSTSAFAATDACLSYPTGETEDYNINIIPVPIAFHFTPFRDTLYDRVINISVRIVQRDVGLNVSDSLKPRIWARRQGSSAWRSFKGELFSGTANDGVWQFPVKHDSLGIRINSCDSVQYYFVAQDLNTPFNIGYLPEAGTNHTNVLTQITAASVPFGYRLKPRLKDTIYVNGYDCNYTSLTKQNGLFQDIANRKLEGDLVILIESNLTEDGTYGITSSGLNGHHLYIGPASNSTYQISANFTNGSIIRLDGVKNVVIDGSYNGSGRFLRFYNTNLSNYAADSICAIKIYRSCDSITLQNLQMYHVSDIGNGFENAIFISSGTNKNISIRNNYFTGTNAAELPEIFIVSVGANNEATIKGNEFQNFKDAGVKMLTAGSNWVIDSNHFYKTLVPTYFGTSCTPITVKGNGHIITRNYIGGQAPFCGGISMKLKSGTPFIGISVNDSTSTVTNIISNNRIDNIEVGTPDAIVSSSFTGISTENDCLIKENIIGNPNLPIGTYSLKLLAGYIGGIGAGGRRPAEVRGNIVAAITNTTGAVGGSTSMGGIGRGNSSGGVTAYNAPTIVSNNTVFNLRNTTEGGATGMGVSGGSSNLIEKNTIHDITVWGGTITGLNFYGANASTPGVIQQNRIYNLVNTSMAQGSCCGSEDDAYNGIINGIAINNEITGLDIINNQITLTNNNLATPASIRGIYESYGNVSDPNPKQRIIYNSIYIGGTATSYGGSTAYMSLYRPLKEVYNNLFFNERTGGTKGHFAFRFTENNGPTIVAHTRINNNLYVLPDSLYFAQWIAWYPHISWGTWKFNTAFDDSSYQIFPGNIPSSQLFVDKDHGNLNINFNNDICWYLNNKAKPYSFITGDFDSSVIRSTSVAAGLTDIGSDEFTTNTIEPARICPGGSASFVADLTGSNYQWQADTGSGFVDITDNANYGGTSSATLQLINLPSSWYGYKYRCVVDGNNSKTFSVKFSNTWTGAANTSWENPGNWSCGIVPDSNTDVVINSGIILINSNVTIRSLTLVPGVILNVNPDYTLTITH